MISLEAYFQELGIREGRPGSNLVGRWFPSEKRTIKHCLRTAFRRCGFDHSFLPVNTGVTNQSLGNRVADFFALKMERHLRGFSIRACKGPGYPDRRLVRVSNEKACALELKSTSNFVPTNNNRIVLTSRGEKLRRFFVPPIKHVVVTVLYRRRGGRVWLRDHQVHFLQPSSKVYVRLEASVSQRLLAEARRAGA
jgi:hypothetical protein